MLPMLTAKNLNAYYGQAHILSDLDLEAAAGEVVVLLGRNGAGKSTTLKALIGLVPPSGGEVVFRGERIEGLQPFQIAQRGLGYVPEDRRIFTELTVLENLEVGRQPARQGVPNWTVERLFKLFPNLAETGDRPAAQMSGGEQQMLTIARTLMGNPACILLDEPSEGLAPLIVREIGGIVLGLKGQGLSILLVEQNYHLALQVADRVYVMNKGQIVWDGTPAALEANEDVKRRYLGVA